MFTPVQFGKYFLTERIAVGGMAELFKAKLYGVSGFEKEMVVKQILPKYSRNEEFIKMFIDEAKIAVTLLHGNIVPVYELGRIDGVYFIAMEYVRGKDLAELMETARAKNDPISPEHAAFIAIEICKGLEHAHRRTDSKGNPLNVVHRDISPPNILVSLEGEVKITDFGIAKAAHKLCSTEAGVVKGTFGYMSPEQVRGLPVDYRTDIFSTGILLWEMLTGRRLFTGDSEIDAIERVKETKVPAPSSIGAKVPAAIDPIVFRALARDSGDRFADANELQLELSRFLFTAGNGATATTLSGYMKALFADEKDLEQKLADEVLQGIPTPFAAQPEIIVQRPLDAPRQKGTMDAGAGSPLKISATLALPSLPFEKPLAPPPALAEEEFDEEDEGEKTNVYRGARIPQRPEVPELRFPPKEERPAKASDLLPASGGEEAFEREAANEDLETSRAKATSPSDDEAEVPPSTRDAAKKEGSGLQLIDLVSLPDARDISATAPHAVPLFADADSHAAKERSTSRKKQISGIFSSTMKLFVEGLEEEAPPVPARNPPDEDSAITPIQPLTTDVIRRSPLLVKPTTLGWIFISLVVLGASLFVVYKKTALFTSKEPEDDVATLRPEDVRKETQEPTRKGTIVLSSEPKDAAFFRFMGETPLTLDSLYRGQLLLIEREGYQMVYQRIEPDALAQGKGEVTVTLNPIGPGTNGNLPLPEISDSPSEQRGSVQIKSEPPMAMVWLLVGKDEKVELKNIDTSKSADFKAILQGYRPGLTHISSVDFEEGRDTYSTVVKLERDPSSAVDSGSAQVKEEAEPKIAASAKAAPSAPKATPPAPKATPPAPKAALFSRLKPPAARPKTKSAAPLSKRLPHGETKLKKPASNKVPTKPKEDKTRAGNKLQMPSWAQ